MVEVPDVYVADQFTDDDPDFWMEASRRSKMWGWILQKLGRYYLLINEQSIWNDYGNCVSVDQLGVVDKKLIKVIKPGVPNWNEIWIEAQTRRLLGFFDPS